MAHFSLAVVLPALSAAPFDPHDAEQELREALRARLAALRYNEDDGPEVEAECTVCMPAQRRRAQAGAAAEAEARFGSWHSMVERFKRDFGAAPVLSAALAQANGAQAMWDAYGRWLETWQRVARPRVELTAAAFAARTAASSALDSCSCLGTGRERRSWLTSAEQGARFDYWTLGARALEIPEPVVEARFRQLAGASLASTELLAALLRVAPECMPSALLDEHGAWHESEADGWGIAHLEPALAGLSFYAADSSWPLRFQALLAAQPSDSLVALVDAHC